MVCCSCRRFKNREAARRVRERKSTMLNTYKSQASAGINCCATLNSKELEEQQDF